MSYPPPVNSFELAMNSENFRSLYHLGVAWMIYPKHSHGAGVFTYMKTIKINHSCRLNIPAPLSVWVLDLHFSLGGVLKYFLCSSLPGEMIQWDKYFSDGLKPPTSLGLVYPGLNLRC